MKFASLQIKIIIMFGVCLFLTMGAVLGYGVIAAKNTEVFVTHSSSQVAAAAAEKQLVEKAKAIAVSIQSNWKRP